MAQIPRQILSGGQFSISLSNLVAGIGTVAFRFFAFGSFLTGAADDSTVVEDSIVFASTLLPLQEE